MDKQKFDEIVESVAERQVKYYKRRWNELSENERRDCSLSIRLTEPRSCSFCPRTVTNQVWFISLEAGNRRKCCNICKKTIKIPLKTGLDK